MNEQNPQLAPSATAAPDGAHAPAMYQSLVGNADATAEPDDPSDTFLADPRPRNLFFPEETFTL